MKFSRTWIDTNLSNGERTQLVEWLMERSQNPTGEMILSGLRELFPAFDGEELPSLQSCLTWKKKAWAFELHRRELREESEAAAILAEAGDGSKLDEANRVILQSMIFEQLRALKEGEVEKIDPDLLVAMCRNTSILARQGQTERELRAKLDAMERDRIEAEKVTKDESLNADQKQARIKTIFGIA